MTHYSIQKSGNYGAIIPIPTDTVLVNTLVKYLQYERPGKEFMPRPEWAICKLFNPKKGLFPYGLLSLVTSIMNTYSNK